LNRTGTKAIKKSFFGKGKISMTQSTHTLMAGAAEVNITPHHSMHLAGYPFVARNSTGVHDPLLSTALYLTDGSTPVIFIGNDVLFTGKATVNRVRKQVAAKTGVPEGNILISATHTHSGPVTVRFVAGSHDATLPEPDAHYLQQLEAGMVEAACKATQQAVPARLGVAVADATGIGTNRRHPDGVSDLEVPVLIARSVQTGQPIALMLICNMHPTVLHEDSMVISGDFPGIARQVLQKELMSVPCPVVHHTGASGNQSPRYVTKGNTLAEAERLGRILANAVAKTFDHIQYTGDITIQTSQHFVELLQKKFPAKADAAHHVNVTRNQLERLKQEGKNRQAIRTAEVNWFGAVELEHLCELSQSNALEMVYENCLPAEIQVIRIGNWHFVAWPGEIFIEYALQVKQQYRNVYLITLANGELQGYIVTREAAEQGGYEASNAIFDYRSGDVLVSTTLRALSN
jgi:neutral ceramidase